MNNQDLQKFLNIIDGRIKKYINENKLLKQYCGKIVGEVLGSKNTKYKVKLLGYDTEFTFLNKTGEALSIGDNVYIQTVGTDLTTGVIMYKTKESIVPDFIIEQGNKDGWYYRKWNNGTAECWTTIIYNTDVTQTYGQIFTSATTPLAKKDYPFSFTTIPTEHCTCNTSSAGIMSFEANSTSTTSSYIVWRGNSNSDKSNYRLSIYVIGKWK